MSLIDTVQGQCPNCGEPIELVVDCSINEQVYTEDCFVCCRPMLVNIVVSEQQVPSVWLQREED